MALCLQRRHMQHQRGTMELVDTSPVIYVSEITTLGAVATDFRLQFGDRADSKQFLTWIKRRFCEDFWSDWLIYLMSSNLRVASVLLDAGQTANFKNKHGFMPLHLACANGNLDIAELLLDHGAWANEKNGEGMTPLSCSLRYPMVEMVELLLARGADPWETDDTGRTPLELAEEYVGKSPWRYLVIVSVLEESMNG